jgi:hypothetical protein
MARRGRPKKAKVEEPIEQATDTQPEPVQEAVEPIKPEPEPQELFTIDEAAHHFNVAERDIRLWVEHGILYGPLKHGSVRISRESMLRCRFSHMAIGPLM